MTSVDELTADVGKLHIQPLVVSLVACYVSNNVFKSTGNLLFPVDLIEETFIP